MKIGSQLIDIEKLDRKILKLLDYRMEQHLIASRLIGKAARSTSDKKQLNRIRKHTGKLVGPDCSEQIFKTIFRRSNILKKNDYCVLAFHGEHGAFSEVASRHWNNDCVTIPCREFAEIFDGINAGFFDYGIIPVESTIGGTIGHINDLLLQNKLAVIAAVNLPIHYCLLGHPDEDYRKFRYVHSDIQALAQCREFSVRNNLEPVPHNDSASAAKWLSEERPKSSSVIASKSAADIYQLKIIKENIDDIGTNRKRFFILSNVGNNEKYDKVSIVFSAKNIRATLLKVLLLFRDWGMNITRIDSVPTSTDNFIFFLDFIKPRGYRGTQNAFATIEKITKDFRVLGLYKEILVNHC